MSGIKQMPLSKWITASLINILKYEEHLFPILPMDKVLLIICILFIAILHIVNKIYTHIYDKLLSIIFVFLLQQFCSSFLRMHF